MGNKRGLGTRASSLGALGNEFGYLVVQTSILSIMRRVPWIRVFISRAFDYTILVSVLSNDLASNLGAISFYFRRRLITFGEVFFPARRIL